MTAVTLVPLLQLRVPLVGFVPIARVTTVELSLVTTWPSELTTATTGCWLHVAPAVPPPGWVANCSLVAVPAVIVNVALVAPVRPELVATSV